MILLIFWILLFNSLRFSCAGPQPPKLRSTNIIDWITNLENLNDNQIGNIKIPLSIIDKGINGKIIQGVEATKYSHPYQIGLLLLMKEGNNWCGGSLLDKNTILTAAHCLDAPNLNSNIVFLGAHDITVEEPERIAIKTRRENWRIHEQWNPDELKNDIGLIRLPITIEFNSVIQPVRLPSLNEVNSNYENRLMHVSGWGRFSDNIDSLSPVLQYVDQEILPNSICSIFFPDLITDKSICTNGFDNHSPCKGDSGGPLTILENDGKPTLIGIVSFGLMDGCEYGFPAVYTRITSHLQWLKELDVNLPIN